MGRGVRIGWFQAGWEQTNAADGRRSSEDNRLKKEERNFLFFTKFSTFGIDRTSSRHFAFAETGPAPACQSG